MDAYRRRVLTLGGTHKERVVNHMRETFRNHLMESPASHSAVIEGESYNVLMADRRFTDEELNGKYIFTEWDNPCSVGDYVRVLHKLWFIDLEEEETVETKRGYRLSPCTNILKWQDDEGQIHEFPCYATDKTSVYSDGLSKGAHITTSTYQLQVIVPYNQFTNKIKTNDRFIFNHSALYVYSVSRIDELTRPGLIYLIMKRDELLVTEDDLENNLSKPISANAKIVDNIVTPDNMKEDMEYTVEEIVGKDNITIREKSVEYFVPTTSDVEWELIGDIANIVVDGNRCHITPKDTYGNIILNAYVDDRQYSKRISIGFM